MAQPELGQQFVMGRELFLPGMTVQAMRDSRYRHPANAVAELIDNSIDARASLVNLLIEENQVRVNTRLRWRVGELAVLDNGSGMSDETLVQALRFGGRTPPQSIQKIGKYGMGLPTASVSQCKRVDVWTWTGSIDKPSHCYIDVESIQSGEQREIPEPDQEPIPNKWLVNANKEILEAPSGTIVVWKNIDRITAQADTIFDRVEKEIGRIYRHFINDDELSIRMAAFRQGQRTFLDDRDRTVRPNDPLFLMRNSATAEPWHEEPMFEYSHEKDYPIDIGGKQETVTVTYSRVKQAALGNQAANPGSLPHGQDARFNMGVSVVRENREILVDNAFVREGGRGNIPMNRWWGCEVRFNEGCDDLFGIDHNKQLVATFTNAARELLNSEEDDTAVLSSLSMEDDPIYQIVADIRSETRTLLRDIGLMFDRRRKQRREVDEPGQPSYDPSPENEAAKLASDAVKDGLDEGSETPTATDKDHEEAEPVRQEQIVDYLSGQGFEDADTIAAALVRNDFRFDFKSVNGRAFEMFTCDSRGGVLFVNLNINHQLYEFIKFIEQEADVNENPVVWKAAVGLRTLLLAWSRMEDQIESPEKTQEVQSIAADWGRQASMVLRQLNQQSTQNDP